jgi:hypothetical protein
MFWRNNSLRTIGLVCLILANVSRWLLHPTGDLTSKLADLTIGLFFGISIACLLLSLRRSSRQCTHNEA